MGYWVLGKTEDVMQGFEPRRGLEGPYNFSGRILYYDPKAGRHWDPRTDFYVDPSEMDMISQRMVGGNGVAGLTFPSN
jgi:hypothetical protein